MLYLYSASPRRCRQRAQSLVLALLPLVAVLPGSASALTQGQCADAVVRACNKAFPNNYNGRIACVNNGLDTCDTLASKPNRGSDANRSVSSLKLRR